MVPHPLSLLVLEVAITVFVIGFTGSQSFIRLAALPLMILCVWLAVPNCMTAMGHSPWAATVGGYSITFLFQYITVALLQKWSFFRQSAKTMLSSDTMSALQDSSGDVLARARFGWIVTTSFRWSGTAYEVKNVPPFLSHDPKCVPSRAVFLRHNITTILTCFLVLDILSLGTDPEKKPLFSPIQIPFFRRLHELSWEQAMMRLFGTLGAGIGVYCSQNGMHSIFALLDVFLMRSEIKSWRPLFGSLADAYTVRRFWSMVWHQNNRLKLSESARYIVYKILKLQRDSVATQYTTLFFTFFISGILHSIIDVSSGIPWRQSGAIAFFCTQALGIILEEWVQKVYNSNRDMKSQADRPALFVRMIGWVWVTMFMAWSAPVWLYPMLYRDRGAKDSILPYSVAAFLMHSIQVAS